MIIVKENVTSSGDIEIDQVDWSVTRTEELLLKLFNESGLVCMEIQHQQSFPKGLYPVKMFALRPKENKV